MSFVENSLNFLKTLPDLYVNNVKSDNKQIQQVIDWAPSLIMASGMIIAPYASLALGILTAAGHHYQLEIITAGLMKNVLFAASLAIGAKSIVPVAKALLYSTTAIVSVVAAAVLYGTSANFDELVAFAKLLKDQKFDDAKVEAFAAFENYTIKLNGAIVRLHNFIVDQFKPKTV